MTVPIHINTLEYSRKLAAAGIPPPQADAQVQALYDVLAQSLVVAPDDLTLLRTDILARIDVVKVELNARIDALEQTLSARIDALEQSLSARIDALEQSLSARIDAIETRIDALERRIDALENYVRARFKTLNWMMTASLAMHAIVLYKLFAPHS